MKEKIILIPIVICLSLITVCCTNGKKHKVDNQSDVITVSDTKDTLAVQQDTIVEEKIVFIENWEQYKTIEELVEYQDFKNNVLYIDLWGVYCGPCVKEFSYTKDLKARYKDKPVKFVYICDGPDTASIKRKDILDPKLIMEQWKTIIYKFELEGYHIPKSRSMHRSIMSIKGFKGTMSPNYILVNKNGVILPNAPRPSSGDKLYQKIDELL